MTIKKNHYSYRITDPTDRDYFGTYDDTFNLEKFKRGELLLSLPHKETESCYYLVDKDENIYSYHVTQETSFKHRNNFKVAIDFSKIEELITTDQITSLHTNYPILVSDTKHVNFSQTSSVLYNSLTSFAFVGAIAVPANLKNFRYIASCLKTIDNKPSRGNTKEQLEKDITDRLYQFYVDYAYNFINHLFKNELKLSNTSTSLINSPDDYMVYNGVKTYQNIADSLVNEIKESSKLTYFIDDYLDKSNLQCFSDQEKAKLLVQLCISVVLSASRDFSTLLDRTIFGGHLAAVFEHSGSTSKGLNQYTLSFPNDYFGLRFLYRINANYRTNKRILDIDINISTEDLNININPEQSLADILDQIKI